MKRLLKAILVTSIFSLPSLSSANYNSVSEACDHYKTSYDVTYCLSKLFMESDKELNQVYKALKNSLNKSTKRGLTKVQREWIKYRNYSCEYTGSIDVDCNYRVNRERTEYLRDRLRECKTGNCRNELITSPSW